MKFFKSSRKIFFLFITKNTRIFRATSKLTDLCNKFEQTLIMRSAEARKKANLPIEATQIPNYRQLLLTKHFSQFSRCTCDHSSHGDSDQPEKQHHQHSTSVRKKCGKHSQRNKLSRSSGSSSDSSFERSSSDSDSLNTTSTLNMDSNGSSSSSGSGSSMSSADSSGPENEKSKKEKVVKKSKKKPEEFHDIKSMEMNRKQNHPERLHKDLCFNEPDQVR